MSMNFYLKIDLYFRKIEDLALIPRLIKGTIINGDKKFTQEILELINKNGLEFVVGLLSKRIVNNQIEKINSEIKGGRSSAFNEIDKLLYHIKPIFENLKVDKKVLCEDFYGFNPHQSEILGRKVLGANIEISHNLEEFFNKISLKDFKNISNTEMIELFLDTYKIYTNGQPLLKKEMTNEYEDLFHFIETEHTLKLQSEFIEKFISYIKTNNLSNDLFSVKIKSSEKNLESLINLRNTYTKIESNPYAFSSFLIKRIKILQAPLINSSSPYIYGKPFPEYYLLSDTTITPMHFLSYAAFNDENQIIIAKNKEAEKHLNELSISEFSLIKLQKVKNEFKDTNLHQKTKELLSKSKFRKDQSRMLELSEKCSVYIEESIICDVIKSGNEFKLINNNKENSLVLDEQKTILLEETREIKDLLIQGKIDSSNPLVINLLNKLLAEENNNEQTLTQFKKEINFVISEEFITELEFMIDYLKEPLKSQVMKVIESYEKKVHDIKESSTKAHQSFEKKERELYEHKMEIMEQVEIFLLTGALKEKMFLLAEVCAENMIFLEDLTQYRMGSAENTFESYNSILFRDAIDAFDNVTNFVGNTSLNVIEDISPINVLGDLLDARNQVFNNEIPENINEVLTTTSQVIQNPEESFKDSFSNYNNDKDIFLNSIIVNESIPIVSELIEECKNVAEKLLNLTHHTEHKNTFNSYH